jgi:hypothetical protein
MVVAFAKQGGTAAACPTTGTMTVIKQMLVKTVRDFFIPPSLSMDVLSSHRRSSPNTPPLRRRNL